ncbi:MAG: polymer-forming cytoskeletal protein [Pseudomonadota bacterium]|nr:polymer-forming cytoskeletal protein [Pseudomonadota bacterium]
MFGNRNNKNAPIDSLIGAGTLIEGNVNFRGGLRIDGSVEGRVTGIDGETTQLVLSEQGRVKGEIRARRVLINGEVNGPVFATESLELMPKARVQGDVHYQRIEVHLGAQVTGRLIHSDANGAAGEEPGKIVDLKANKHGI